jgi:hypothetical protein
MAVGRCPLGLRVGGFYRGLRRGNVCSCETLLRSETDQSCPRSGDTRICVSKVRLRSRDLGVEFLRIDLDQWIACADLLVVSHQNFCDQPSNLRRHGSGIRLYIGIIGTLAGCGRQNESRSGECRDGGNTGHKPYAPPDQRDA